MILDIATGQEITPKAEPTGKPLIDLAEQIRETLAVLAEAQPVPDPYNKRALAFGELVHAANRFYLMAHVLEGDV